MSEEEDKEIQEQAPKILLYLIDKSEDFFKKEKFFRSFLLGIFAIILGLFLAGVYYCRHFILFGFISIILIYFLMYWFGV